MTKIYHINEINFQNIEVSKNVKKKRDTNDIIIPIFYKTEQIENLVVEIPALYLNDSVSKDIVMLPLKSKNEKMEQDIIAFFRNMDNCILKKIQNILTSLRNDGRYEHIDYNNISYRSIINEIENDDSNIYKNGIIKYRINLDKKNGTRIYDSSKKMLTESEYKECLIKGVYIKSILEINSLIIRNNNIYVFIKPLQIAIKIKQKEVVLDEYSFIDSDSEDINDNINNTDNVVGTFTEYLEKEDSENN